MHSYELNKHGKIVFPSNCFPDLDFSTFESLDQLDAVVRRDFDSKAPTGTDILEQINDRRLPEQVRADAGYGAEPVLGQSFQNSPCTTSGRPGGPTCRARRDDVFVPILTPWEDRETKVSAVLSAYPNLPAQWDAEVEDSIFEVLFDVFGHRRNHATKLSAVIPTVADLLSDPGNQTLRLNRYDPDFRRYSYDRDHRLQRGCGRAGGTTPLVDGPAQPVSVGSQRGHPGPCRRIAGRRLRGGVPSAQSPRSNYFLSRVASGHAPKKARPAAPEVAAPVRPYPAIDVRNDFAVQPRIEAIAAVHGDQVCTNEDLIRNSAYNWSPMSADEITAKTGIEAASLHLGQPRGPVVAGRPVGDGARQGGSRGDRRGDRLHLHQLPADTVDRDLAVRRVGHPADARLVRPRRRVRRPQLRAGRSHQGAPIGSAAGAGGLRGEVLRQDRQRPAIPDDLRRRRSRHYPRRRTRGFAAGHRVHANLCQRSDQPGQLDPVAQPRRSATTSPSSAPR